MSDQLIHLYALLWAVRVPDVLSLDNLYKKIRKLHLLVSEHEDDKQVLACIEEILGCYPVLEADYRSCLQVLQQDDRPLVLPSLAQNKRRNVMPVKVSTLQKIEDNKKEIPNVVAVIDVVKAKTGNSPDEQQQSLFEEIVAVLKKRFE